MRTSKWEFAALVFGGTRCGRLLRRYERRESDTDGEESFAFGKAMTWMQEGLLHGPAGLRFEVSGRRAFEADSWRASGSSGWGIVSVPADLEKPVLGFWTMPMALGREVGDALRDYWGGAGGCWLISIRFLPRLRDVERDQRRPRACGGRGGTGVGARSAAEARSLGQVEC